MLDRLCQNCLYLRLLPHRGGEVDLRPVVSSRAVQGHVALLTKQPYYFLGTRHFQLLSSILGQ
jgi:hypothetical protein